MEEMVAVTVIEDAIHSPRKHRRYLFANELVDPLIGKRIFDRRLDRNSLAYIYISHPVSHRVIIYR